MPTEQITLHHLPPSLKLYISCYKSVTNTPFLRQQLLSSNQAFNYAFIDASTILSRRHLLTACFRAMNDYIHDRLRSNNVQSEIVFCLSPNNNIGEAFRRYGISDTSTTIVVLKVSDEESVDEGDRHSRKSVEEHLKANVEGEEAGFTDEWFQDVGDIEKVRKNYKVVKQQKKGVRDERDERMDVEVQVLGAMALRGAT